MKTALFLTLKKLYTIQACKHPICKGSHDTYVHTICKGSHDAYVHIICKGSHDAHVHIICKGSHDAYVHIICKGSHDAYVHIICKGSHDAYVHIICKESHDTYVHIILVTQARVICPICMLKGPRAEGTHIRQIKSSHVTTNIALWQADKLAMSTLRTPVFIGKLTSIDCGL